MRVAHLARLGQRREQASTAASIDPQIGSRAPRFSASDRARVEARLVGVDQRQHGAERAPSATPARAAAAARSNTPPAFGVDDADLGGPPAR